MPSNATPTALTFSPISTKDKNNLSTGVTYAIAGGPRVGLYDDNSVAVNKAGRRSDSSTPGDKRKMRDDYDEMNGSGGGRDNQSSDDESASESDGGFEDFDEEDDETNEAALVTIGLPKKKDKATKMKNKAKVEATRQVSCPDVAYCAAYRTDGRLLAVGGGSGLLKVVSATGSRTTLRTLTGMSGTGIVRSLAWTNDGKHILSGGDDGTFRMFGIDDTSNAEGVVLKGHGDAIRSIVPNLCNRQEFAATGSYDHKIKLWDLKTKECVHTFDHGAPVEAMVVLPGNALLVSAGSTSIKVWDVVKRTLVHTSVNHTKTITCLAVSPVGGAGSDNSHRLISGGIDGHVKIYDPLTFNVLQGFKYSEPITVVGVSPCGSKFVVGMSDGVVSVKTREATTNNPLLGVTPKKKVARGGTYAYFNRGGNELASEGDYLIEVDKKQRLKTYDKLLKSFRYAEALDSALSTKHPATVTAVLEELAFRRGIKEAISNRDEEEIEPLLAFTCRYIVNPLYTSVLVGVATLILDVYANEIGVSPVVDELLAKLGRGVKTEIKTQMGNLRLIGAIECIMAGAEMEASGGL